MTFRSANLLTPRQLQIFALARDGLSNKEIAQRLGIRPDTVKNTMGQVYLRLGVVGRTEAVIVALRRGILPLE